MQLPGGTGEGVLLRTVGEVHLYLELAAAACWMGDKTRADVLVMARSIYRPAVAPVDELLHFLANPEEGMVDSRLLMAFTWVCTNHNFRSARSWESPSGGLWETT